MKSKPHYSTIITLLLLVLSVSYLISHLVHKGMYIDAAFAAASLILLMLLVYFIRRGK